MRRLTMALPFVVAGLGLAMSASSTPRPKMDRTAEAVARVTGGELSQNGLNAVMGRLDQAQLALAVRFDPTGGLKAQRLGLTPGWESLTLAGKPSLAPGASGLKAQRLNAAMPAVAGALRPAQPFVLRTTTAEGRRRALRCLTQAVYFEAALESTEGQEAVAQVVLNRVRDANYPKTVCGVVFEGAERTTGCQFSFTCDGSLAQGQVAWAWNRARVVAERALSGYVASRVGTATHYHADYVHPWWAPSLTKVDQIGAHIFYRWKGFAGETSAFNLAHNGREPLIDEKRFSKPRLVVPEEPVDPALPLEGVLTTVEVDGATRVVGVATLGGRRIASAQEIADINQSLAAFEAPKPEAPATPAPAGATAMAVEEVGKPAT